MWPWWDGRAPSKWPAKAEQPSEAGCWTASRCVCSCFRGSPNYCCSTTGLLAHVFLTFCPPEERSPLGWLPASYQILSVITHLLCVCSAASHTCFRLTATCLDLAAHRKGCCHVTRLLFSANVFDRHASVLSTSSCEQARLAKILAGLERFGSPSRTLKQAVSCTEEHLRKSSEIASPRSGQR